MKTLIPFFFLVFISVILTFCVRSKMDDKDKNQTETPSTPSDGGLFDVHWKLTSINNKPVTDYPVQNKEPYILIKKEGNRAEGTGGCNGMGGTYLHEVKNQIVFTNMASTKMACPDMTLESDFHAIIEMTKYYSVAGKNMYLLNVSKDTLAGFVNNR